jgi:hypothetical protein
MWLDRSKLLNNRTQLIITHPPIDAGETSFVPGNPNRFLEAGFEVADAVSLNVLNQKV